MDCTSVALVQALCVKRRVLRLILFLSGRDDRLHASRASQSALVAGEPRLFPRPLVGGTFRVRGFSAHPRNLALLRHVHRREPSQLFRHRFLLEPFALPNVVAGASRPGLATDQQPLSDCALVQTTNQQRWAV